MGNIQQDIKQSKFKNLTEKVFIGIFYTANWLRDLQIPIFKQYDLQPQHFNVLKIVKGRHPQPASPSDILEVMLDKRRDLTRLVDKLVAMQLLHRQTSTTNGRKVAIFITELGLQKTKEMETQIDLLFQQLTTLSPEEAEQLSFLLDKLRN